MVTKVTHHIWDCCDAGETVVEVESVDALLILSHHSYQEL